ncbi:MAG: RimK family protein [Balneolaceae bacterium]|nr:RimK family protein [Balneolaceae bacterium]
MKYLLIVDNPKKWPLDITGVEIVSAREYLTQPSFSALRNAKVFNLCRSYRYQSIGYYVSLLASARGHKPIPNILAILDLKSQAIIRIISDELNTLIQKSLQKIQTDHFTLSIYFGKNLARKYDRLSQRLFAQFQAPLLRAEFTKREGEWILRSLQPISASEVPEDHKPFVSEMAQEFFKKKNLPSALKEYRYDLAILVNPDEELPPSDEKAIQRFVKAAEKVGFYTELITRDDYSRINEFDALFIRETTSVNHHTYRMARRAEAEGLVVIDDPESILRCTNKVYLAELLKKHSVPAPATMILSRENLESAAEKVEYPCILKKPDSSFSQGVVKANDRDEFMRETSRLFEKSDLLIVQEFIQTTFDWRIGVLNHEPLFACRYHMARKHWQIYERTDDGKTHSGSADTIPVSEVPKEVLKQALKAARLIGSGLYGVDVKELNGKVYVIEVNDNPSIDAGIEDAVLKDQLYLSVMKELLSRIEQQKEWSAK